MLDFPLIFLDNGIEASTWSEVGYWSMEEKDGKIVGDAWSYNSGEGEIK
ncbi:hypothetical protein KAW55_02130 [bacterium]|nr:hypothetical protein [bacterium]